VVHFLKRLAMHIGELALATGLSRDTLRFYEKRGLLRARRQANGYRDYPADAVQWLCYLRSEQALGFTLKEIEAGMPLLEAIEPGAPAGSPALRDALQRKLADIDARIAALGILRTQLARELERPGALCLLEAEAVQSVSAAPLRVSFKSENGCRSLKSR
jgi:MerR family copper efflux transcriptional regulator